MKLGNEIGFEGSSMCRVCGAAAPCVLLSLGDHEGAQRVCFYVSHAMPQVAVIEYG
ncbi:MAG: hypothetical protein ACR2IE_11405 [Candidatus Sumerlaeaceae bacterium]